MEYKVIKEFPGLKVGDLLIEEEGTGFYVNNKEDIDIAENSESVYINSVAIRKEIVEAEKDYFEPVVEKAIVSPTTEEVAKAKRDKAKKEVLEKEINDMMQVASIIESDLVLAINDYHHGILADALSRVYAEVNILSKFL